MLLLIFSWVFFLAEFIRDDCEEFEDFWMLGRFVRDKFLCFFSCILVCSNRDFGSCFKFLGNFGGFFEHLMFF